MAFIKFTVPGRPQGKARARTFYNHRTGHSQSITPEGTVLYENLIKTRYLERAGESVYIPAGRPVSVHVTARFLPPASASKHKKEQMVNSEIRPTKKPDADNILKVVLDALNGVAYHDDTQVIMASIEKCYDDAERLDVTVSGDFTGGEWDAADKD